ncbi:MAG: response regulator [Bradyrhizobium sp.]
MKFTSRAHETRRVREGAGPAGSFEGASVTAVSGIQGVKVLVVDDSSTIRRSAEVFLQQAGCEVLLAEDGFAALAKIADHRPDVIFVDIMMPRLDGYQTCTLIKRNPRFGETPVIMLSSKDGLFDRARGRMAGSDEYLTKPFVQQALTDAVTKHARRPVLLPEAS